MGGRGSSSLPIFENRAKVSWCFKKSSIILKKFILFVCIYGQDFIENAISILEKQPPKSFSVELSFVMTYMKRLSKCLFFKKLSLPRKIADCAPEQWLSFKVFKLKISWYLLLLRKCFFTRLINSLPIFVFTFWQYGGLSVLSIAIFKRH